MSPGDRIVWYHKPCGGYGYTVLVAGVVVSQRPGRYRIEVARRINGEWVRQRKTVKDYLVGRRTEPCAELGET